MDGVFLTSRCPASLVPAGLFVHWVLRCAAYMECAQLLFRLVVDENEQLLAGVHAELGVDVAHVVVERRRLGDTAK